MKKVLILLICWFLNIVQLVNYNLFQKVLQKVAVCAYNNKYYNNVAFSLIILTHYIDFYSLLSPISKCYNAGCRHSWYGSTKESIKNNLCV